ncbi:MAG: hypothetical protein ACFE0Q_06935 [Anaerolineae bacterium]
MSTQKPDPNKQHDPAQHDDAEQSDALKQALLKLKNSGMLTHIPDELASLVGEERSASASVSDANTAPANPEPPAQPDDPTLVSRPRPESPTVASADDVEQHADERAKWAAVMSGWDDMDSAPPAQTSDAPTISSRGSSTPVQTESVASAEQQSVTLRRKEVIKPDTPLTASREQTPWTLQQFFDGEIDLEQELLKRFPTVPAMNTIKFRTLGMNSGRKVATLSAQDGSASMIVDADIESKVVQMSFTLGSMMTLRYVLSDIPANNRERWLDLMRRDQGGLAFLWNEDRWREDYLICVSRQYATNIFAFSPHNFESAVRITNDVTQQLLDWLEDIWNTDPEPEADDDPPLLTW